MSETAVKPGYQVTELGVIPEDWELISLDLITTELVRGPFGGALKKEFFVKSGYKVYEQRNAIYSTTGLGNYYIDKDKFNELSRFKVNAEDFIVSCSGTIGCIFEIPQNAPNGVINQALLKIRLNTNIVDKKYFEHVFKSSPFQERITDNSHGGAMQNLVGMDIFKKTLFQLPPLPEQKAIAAALSDVDALITAQEALIAKKRDIKTATMQELLTGKVRLGAFGQQAGASGGQSEGGVPPGYQQTELGVIPEDWRLKRLGEVLKIRHGKSQHTVASPDGHIPILATGGQIGWATEALYSKPSVLIGRKGTIDKPLFMNQPFWTVDTLFYSELSDFVDPRFIFYKFLLIDWYSYNEASGVPSLNARTIENIAQVIPNSKKEQTLIADVLSDMDAEITALEAQRDKTRAIKQGMMQELLTGKTRLL